jgi:drug/metabolite transporter (DMT)-like permease
MCGLFVTNGYRTIGSHRSEGATPIGVLLVVSVISAVLYGWSDYTGGRAARRMPALRVTLIMEFMMIIAYAVAVMVDPAPISSQAMLWGALAGAGGTLGVTAFYAALASGSMSIASPVTGTTSAVIPVIVGLLLGERPGALTIAGITLAVGSVALISGGGGSGSGVVPRQLVLALAAGGSFGLWFIGLERAGDDSGWWPLLAARLLALPCVLAVDLVLRKRGFDPVGLWGSDGARWALGAGVMVLAANIAYLIAVRGGMLTVTAAIVSLYPASTIALALTIDRERLTRLQGLGIALALSALVLVGLGT